MLGGGLLQLGVSDPSILQSLFQPGKRVGCLAMGDLHT